MANDVEPEPPNTSVIPAQVDLSLELLHSEFLAHQASDNFDQPFKTSQTHLHVIDDRVTVDAVAADDPQKVAEALEKLGATGVAVVGVRLSCRLPILAIDDLVNIKGLKAVRPYLAMTDR